MRYLVAKDKRKRILFAKSEMDQLIFKILRKNKIIAQSNKKFDKKIKAYYKSLQRDQFHSRIRNRCVISGKAGWIFSRFKVSRMQFREMFGKGFFYGLKRSSW